MTGKAAARIQGAAARKGKRAGNFTNALLKEANELSQSRQLAESQQQRIQNEIELIQRATTDETLIAEALRNFEALFEVLPFEDRLALMEQLVSEIRVSRIEPEKFASHT